MLGGGEEEFCEVRLNLTLLQCLFHPRRGRVHHILVIVTIALNRYSISLQWKLRSLRVMLMSQDKPESLMQGVRAQEPLHQRCIASKASEAVKDVYKRLRQVSLDFSHFTQSGANGKDITFMRGRQKGIALISLIADRIS